MPDPFAKARGSSSRSCCDALEQQRSTGQPAGPCCGAGRPGPAGALPSVGSAPDLSNFQNEQGCDNSSTRIVRWAMGAACVVGWRCVLVINHATPGPARSQHLQLACWCPVCGSAVSEGCLSCRPRTIQDVQAAVRLHTHVRATGEGHSWNQVGADTPGSAQLSTACREVRLVSISTTRDTWLTCACRHRAAVLLCTEQWVKPQSNSRQHRPDDNPALED